ncbi:hypothetical protein [Hydrogenothermus marinus]|uniref:Uncharacterized protein n=1 Tax=Hydrogenothermus marinus TaxID=133270 RepID=A0A3M0BRR2_9AQUI|nr:hypothetical protein [Hydrogenothermus marinus]RMA97528.1 hypothetical protein CLV39_0141 [Hydrogenothermus marinus]
MDNLLKKRQLYFASLFSSFIYFALIIILVGKIKPYPIKDFYIYILTATSIVILITAFFTIKGKLLDLKSYKLFLILNHIPLLLGFLLTIIGKNYIYILNGFFIFLIGYMILIPRGKNGLFKKN